MELKNKIKHKTIFQEHAIFDEMQIESEWTNIAI